MGATNGLIETLKDLGQEEKLELLKRIEESASYNESVYHGCCRSVLKALQIHFGLENDVAIKASTALGGGVARTGEGCGALLGGLMAIGLAYGPDAMEDTRTSAAYQKTMDCGMKLSDRFKKEFGSIRCHEVQKKLFGRHYDVRNAEDTKEFRKSAHKKCEDLVSALSARFAAEVILDAFQEKD